MRPGRENTLDDLEDSSTFSTLTWVLIIFGILFILYAFTPPLREAVNSTLGGLFSPLIQMIQQASKALQYF